MSVTGRGAPAQPAAADREIVISLVRPLGEVTDSTVKRSSRPFVPSQRDMPRPRVIGTITRCMKSTRSAWRN